ncbi:Smr/MutS family protein [Ancylobacter pratisalsi]|uniref:DNA mismatch repair protein MutS n=1 Tax=Ancylobacter pratisalsi TaxID=1745854 RepID=A0A6P1YLQ7_9HYPH|nr:Smr/MutS family protein [Ancylobacter pratisalsi]QIB34022.1 DNA mismatch repair protein MutS [Ancylobacter pratisalsi]
MSGKGDNGGRSRRRRALDAQERELWDYVTRSVHRLRPEKMPPLPELKPEEMPREEAPATPPSVAVKTARSAPPSPPKRPPPPPPLTPLAPLEPKLRRRLTRGAQVDARLDLHGMTQAAAHGRLFGFLRGAQLDGHSLVLVITGKGDGGGMLAGEGGRGVLRRIVPQWLSSPEMRAIVVGFETAARGHGGEGALYVRVRRAREGGR